MEAAMIKMAKSTVIKKFLVTSKLSIVNNMSGMRGRITFQSRSKDMIDGKAKTEANLIFKLLNL